VNAAIVSLSGTLKNESFLKIFCAKESNIMYLSGFCIKIFTIVLPLGIEFNNIFILKEKE
jgi:hypothetical protein